jgi:hypothetical protein
VFGAVVYSIVSIPVQMLTLPMQEEIAEMLSGSVDVPPDVVEIIEQLSGAGPVAMLFGFVVILVAAMVFSTLGGLLGTVVFRRNRPMGTHVAPDA